LRKTFAMLILTPSGEVFSGEAEYLDVPASDGRMGILAGHATMVARLSAGELRASLPSGDSAWNIEEGFLRVYDNEAAILTTVASLVRPAPVPRS